VRPAGAEPALGGTRAEAIGEPIRQGGVSGAFRTTTDCGRGAVGFLAVHGRFVLAADS